MGKKRDVVTAKPPKKRKFDNVIDFQAFKADRDRAALRNADASERAIQEMLAWLPSMDVLDEAEPKLTRMLRISGSDGSTYFAIVSNTEGRATSFFGSESEDGSPKTTSDLEWFIIGRFQPGEPPAIVRQTDLERIAASRSPKGMQTRVSPLAAMEPMVLEESELE